MKHWLLAGFAAAAMAAETPTYSKDVAPILNTRCVHCHRKGEAAPMTFGSYKEVRPWAKAIRESVLSAKMPPWLADPKFGHFKNDRRLPESERAVIAKWVDGGAPEGDPAGLAKPPEFTEGWNIGKPDLVFDIGTDFEVPERGTVPYKYFRVPSNFKEDTWVEAAEIRPDNRSVVHHVIVFMIQPDGKRIGDGGDLLIGWAPGDTPIRHEPGTAVLVKAGTTFNIQMHYTTNGKAAKDRSYFGLRLAKKPPVRQAITGRAINTRLAIPAGAANHEERASFTLKKDVDVLTFMPHMHVRGKAFQYTVVYPDGRDQVVLKVPKYDFAWQLSYDLKEPLRLPAGTRIDCVAHYDNSPNNPHNPDPSKEVRWGDQTWEEMMIGWFTYTVPAEVAVAGVR